MLWFSPMKNRRRENFYFSFVRSLSLSLFHIIDNEGVFLQLWDASPVVARESYYFSVLHLLTLSLFLTFSPLLSILDLSLCLSIYICQRIEEIDSVDL